MRAALFVVRRGGEECLLFPMIGPRAPGRQPLEVHSHLFATACGSPRRAAICLPADSPVIGQEFLQQNHLSQTCQQQQKKSKDLPPALVRLEEESDETMKLKHSQPSHYTSSHALLLGRGDGFPEKQFRHPPQIWGFLLAQEKFFPL